MSPRKPLRIDVIAYAPSAFFHCLHCELIWQESPVRLEDRREQLQTSLPEDLKQVYQQVSDWVHATAAAYGERLRFRIIDAASLEGLMKSLRYGIRRYPAVIVDGTATTGGTRFEQAQALIERQLAATPG
jgi:hypothetical protein